MIKTVNLEAKMDTKMTIQVQKPTVEPVPNKSKVLARLSRSPYGSSLTVRVSMGNDKSRRDFPKG